MRASCLTLTWADFDFFVLEARLAGAEGRDRFLWPPPGFELLEEDEDEELLDELLESELLEELESDPVNQKT